MKPPENKPASQDDGSDEGGGAGVVPPRPPEIGAEHGTHKCHCNYSKREEPEKPIEKVRTYLEIAGIIAGIIGLVLLYIQTDLAVKAMLQGAESNAASGQDTVSALNASRRAAEAAERAASIAAGTLEEMRRSNDLSDASLKTSQDALRMEQRAWLSFVGVTPELDPANPSKIFRVSFKNTGRTPALGVTARIRVANGLNETDPRLYALDEIAPQGIGTIGVNADGSVANAVPTVDFYPPPSLTELKENKRTLWVVSRIDYTDVFGRPHVSRLCVFWVAASPAWNYCKRHNDAN